MEYWPRDDPECRISSFLCQIQRSWKKRKKIYNFLKVLPWPVNKIFSTAKCHFLVGISLRLFFYFFLTFSPPSPPQKKGIGCAFSDKWVAEKGKTFLRSPSRGEKFKLFSERARCRRKKYFMRLTFANFRKMVCSLRFFFWLKNSHKREGSKVSSHIWWWWRCTRFFLFAPKGLNLVRWVLDFLFSKANFAIFVCSVNVCCFSFFFLLFSGCFYFHEISVALCAWVFQGGNV